MWRASYSLEKPDGAVVQFGGQTAIKLTESLMKMGVPILGTKAEDVDAAEDRELFDEILEKNQNSKSSRWNRIYGRGSKGGSKPSGLSGTWCVRPMYLADRACRSPFNDDEIEEFIGIINRIAQDHPILVDKYLQGKEIEVDAVCDGDGHPDSGYHGAHRENRCPFRRQYFRISGADDQRPCKRDDRGIYEAPGTGTACHRTDQHPVYCDG